MNLYICEKCKVVHTKGSKIQKEHSKFRVKNLVKKYFCLECETFHKKDTMIHLKHYKYRNLKELTPSEIYLNSFKKSWNREKNRQKKLPKIIEYSNINKPMSKTTKMAINSLYGKFQFPKEKIELNNLDFINFLNNINLFLETNIDFFLLFSKYSEIERKFKEIWQNKHISNFGKCELIKNYLEGLTI